MSSHSAGPNRQIASLLRPQYKLADRVHYIEDVLPLGELNKYAQKGSGIGSLNAMHPYFARRPLTAS